MSRTKLSINDYIYFLVILVIGGYLLSIFAVNLTGRVWVNYDIYSDAILAKYMWETKSLFPEGWHFGNQIYTVATPVVATLFYGIVNDAYLALALASCLMTLGIVLSYIWCLKPFVNAKSIIISLLAVIGGLNISYSAHADWKGLQVFYTMASYYACYVIGILITLGVFFRLANHKKVSIIVQLGVLLYNFALGMQSLREMLVLNLPLCAIVVLNLILNYKSLKKELASTKNSCIFAFLALIANICGVFFTKILVSNGVIKQYTIISSVGSDIWRNFKISMRELWDYMGLVIPTTAIEFMELIGAIFSIAIVALALAYIVINYFKCQKISPLGYMVLFFVVSLLAVFCAGLIIISLRNIYFFCWYFLVATSVALLMEEKRKQHLLIISLIIISLFNYKFTFYPSFNGITYVNDVYQEILTRLEADGIQYLYSDWRIERNKISALTYDAIQYGTLEFSGNPADLWLDLDCLYYEDWFQPENFEHAYIVLSDYALFCLESEFSAAYRTTFMDNLEHVYSFDADGEQLHFYLGSEKMYADMIQ